MSEEKAEYNPADKMIKLSGKAYLQVADRIVWFRNDYPEGTIETSIVSIDEKEGSAIFRARITTGNGGIAEATGDETKKDFPQGWIGKAETKAVGRALGYLGYGTAAAGFEEGHRPVDAPQDIRRSPQPQPAPTPRTASQAAPAANGQEHPLLAVIRDDTADPKKRETALHNYMMTTESLAELAAACTLAERANIPEATLDRARAWHNERIVTGKPPAPKKAAQPASYAG